MSEEKKTPAAPATAKVAVKKTDEKLGFFKRVAKWFRDMKSELKKVVWPTGKQTLNNVIVAVVVMVLAGVVIWAFDQLAYLIVQSLISIGG